MPPSVFSYQNYRLFLNALLRANETQSWGIVSRLATACGCQRSHVSRILNGNSQITPEQAEAMARFWRLSEQEGDYFMLLVEHSRAGTPELRFRIEKKLIAAQNAHQNLAKRMNQQRIGPEESEIFYYSTWSVSAIHIATSVPEFQTVSALSKLVSLSPETVEATLKQLKEYSLVIKQDRRWIFNSASTHLPKESPLILHHHQNWRLRALEDVKRPDSKGLHYSIVQSMSKEDYERIKQLILQLVDRYSQIANPSTPEELVVFSCDLFKF